VLSLSGQRASERSCIRADKREPVIDVEASLATWKKPRLIVAQSPTGASSGGPAFWRSPPSATAFDRGRLLLLIGRPGGEGEQSAENEILHRWRRQTRTNCLGRAEGITPGRCRGHGRRAEFRFSFWVSGAPTRQLEPNMLVIQYRRPWATTLGIMITVFVSAVILACIVEGRRIKRVQESYRRRAASYAQLEKLERDHASSLLKSALFLKQLYEREKASIESGRLKLRGRSLDHRGDTFLELLRTMEQENDRTFGSGKRSLVLAQKARAKADRLSSLKRQYAEAAGGFWLPFAPDPLAVRRPEHADEDAAASAP
jgi:hypothetical protein